MPRPISAPYRQGVVRPSQGGDFPVWLATITHPSLATPVRVCSDNCDYSYGGHTYVGISFAIVPLTDDERPARAHCKVMNVNQEMSEALLPLTSAPSVALVCVSTLDFSAPSGGVRSEIGTANVEYSVSGLLLRNATGDVMFVDADILAPDLTSEPWPGKTANQFNAPGVYFQ